MAHTPDHIDVDVRVPVPPPGLFQLARPLQPGGITLLGGDDIVDGGAVVYGPCPICDAWTLEIPHRADPPVTVAEVEAIITEHDAEAHPGALADYVRRHRGEYVDATDCETDHDPPRPAIIVVTLTESTSMANATALCRDCAVGWFTVMLDEIEAESDDVRHEIIGVLQPTGEDT